MRPYGYEPDRITIRETEATFIRQAATRLLDGDSLRSVTKSLNDAGARTPTGNPMTPNVLRRILVSDRIAGREVRRGLPNGKAPWPAILDTSTHKSLKKMFESTALGRHAPGGSHASRTYLLTGGIARCGLCGAQLIARPNNDKKRGYICTPAEPYTGCGRIRINAEPFEEHVVERVLARLMRPDAREKLQALVDAAQARADDAPRVIEKAEHDFDRVARKVVDGDATNEDLEVARAIRKEKIRTARADVKLAESMTSVAALEAEDLIEWWQSASLSQQRVLVETLVEKATVNPVSTRGSKIFDPSRIRLTWRRS